MKLTYVAIGILLLSLTACSSHKLGISDLKELNKGEEKRCDYVKKITISSELGDERAVVHELKKQVLDTGADSYTLDEVVNNGKKTKVTGSAFTCLKK
jgi:hypothetical protein